MTFNKFYSSFQFLAYKEVDGTALRWVDNQLVEGVPHGAVVGGTTVDGFPLYVIQVNGVPGCYDARNSSAEYEKGWKCLTSDTWQYLVLKYGNAKHKHSQHINNIDVILQMTCSDAFLLQFSLFSFKFHWSYFLKVQMSVLQISIGPVAWYRSGAKSLSEPMVTQFTYRNISESENLKETGKSIWSY